jgi:hypothetical protein
MRTAKWINWLIIHSECGRISIISQELLLQRIKHLNWPKAFKLAKNMEGVCYLPDLSPVYGELMVIWLNEE